MEDQNKNLILAVVLSLIVIIGWSVFFAPEPPDPIVADTPTTQTDQGLSVSQSDGATTAPLTATTETRAIGDVLSEGQRIEIASDRLQGSILLKGGRFDDLSLIGYNQTLDPDSGLVRLLSPSGSEFPYYALQGWIATAGADADQVPGPDTEWAIESGDVLTTQSPVTLVWDNGADLTFRKTISVDENFMFTITQSVENTGGSDVVLRPYGLIARNGIPDTPHRYILHEGVVRMSDGELEEITYKDLQDYGAEDGRIEVAENGWLGFTDKYWMTTLVPAPGSDFRSVARYGNSVYQTESIFPAMTVSAGQTVSVDNQLFAGAKEWETIKAYQDNGIAGFVDSIDWGWFFFLTKPIFLLLHWLHGFIGNMGWSIIALTVVIKAAVLPLAWKSYVSMAKMRELQPEMEKLKERAGDDRESMQKGMMELYKKNKVNPASGCMPILLQIPIFFSLYKVIFVTIELRHAPWIGWIRDLSAPDPSSILNLFGLLPFAAPEPGSLLAIFSLGLLPILLGISMWLQQKLNPAPTDPTQKMIFAWMPWVFMFMLGSFASGLVLYWITNNTITFIQQYTIMRSHGHHPNVLGNIISAFRKGETSEEK